MARGGKRTPANPAPVSGPGALSQRTDGGPGQPIREMPAEDYGDRTANAQLQGAAPMASASDAADAPTGMAQPTAPPVPLDVSDPFRPDPNGSLAGFTPPTPARTQAPDMEGVLGRDPDMLLRIMYQRYPHPSIARLIRNR